MFRRILATGILVFMATNVQASAMTAWKYEVASGRSPFISLEYPGNLGFGIICMNRAVPRVIFVGPESFSGSFRVRLDVEGIVMSYRVVELDEPGVSVLEPADSGAVSDMLLGFGDGNIKILIQVTNVDRSRAYTMGFSATGTKTATTRLNCY